MNDIIKEIAEKLQTIPEIKAAPVFPKRVMTTYPTAYVLPFTGNIIREGVVIKELHSIRILVVAPKTYNLELLTGLVEKIVDALYAMIDQGASTFSTFGEIIYTYEDTITDFEKHQRGFEIIVNNIKKLR